MKVKLVSLSVFLLILFAFQSTHAALVTPIVNNYGNVFPTLTEANLEAYINEDPAPWYVSFNLLTTADVKLGTLSQTETNNGTGFNVTAIRLVTIDGSNVEFGTDTFTNPFINSIDRLVIADAIPAGEYALEVSGTGNRTYNYIGSTLDASDFIVRLQVSAVPIPGSLLLLGSSLIGLVGLRKKLKKG